MLLLRFDDVREQGTVLGYVVQGCLKSLPGTGRLLRLNVERVFRCHESVFCNAVTGICGTSAGQGRATSRIVLFKRWHFSESKIIESAPRVAKLLETHKIVY